MSMNHRVGYDRILTNNHSSAWSECEPAVSSVIEIVVYNQILLYARRLHLFLHVVLFTSEEFSIIEHLFYVLAALLFLLRV